jgi:hypothetical protein
VRRGVDVPKGRRTALATSASAPVGWIVCSASVELLLKKLGTATVMRAIDPGGHSEKQKLLRTLHQSTNRVR